MQNTDPQLGPYRISTEEETIVGCKATCNSGCMAHAEQQQRKLTKRLASVKFTVGAGITAGGSKVNT